MSASDGAVSRWWVIRWLLVAYMLHGLIVTLYVLDVIPQQFHADTFHFHHGGDNLDYVRLAADIVHLKFDAPNKYPLGFPLLIAPFMVVMHTVDHDTLLPVVALWWALLMYPLAQALLFMIARDTLRSKWAAVGVLIGWTLLPLLIFGAFRMLGNASMAETDSVHQTWAQMLSDGPATLLTLASFVLWLTLRRSDRGQWWALILGGVLGLLVLIRLTSVFVPLVIGLALLIERRWPAAVIVGGVALIVFSPQLVYQWHFFDHPLRTGYTVLDELPPDGLFNGAYLVNEGWDKLWNRLNVLVLPLLLAGGSGFVLGVIELARTDRLVALVLGGWSALHCAVYAIYYYSWTGGILRFLMPVLPLLVLIGLAAVVALGRWVIPRHFSAGDKPQSL